MTVVPASIVMSSPASASGGTCSVAHGMLMPSPSPPMSPMSKLIACFMEKLMMENTMIRNTNRMTELTRPCFAIVRRSFSNMVMALRRVATGPVFTTLISG